MRRYLCIIAGLALSLAACTPQSDAAKAPAEPTEPAIAALPDPPATPVVDPADDGLSQPAGDLSVLGDFDLWEDREGGRVCKVELESARVIGGHSIVYDEDCISRLELGGDLAAWFAADNGDIVLIDDTRKVLVRLKKLPRDGYYAERQGYLENLNLTRPRGGS